MFRNKGFVWENVESHWILKAKKIMKNVVDGSAALWGVEACDCVASCWCESRVTWTSQTRTETRHSMRPCGTTRCPSSDSCRTCRMWARWAWLYHLPPGVLSLRKEEPLPELFPQTPVSSYYWPRRTEVADKIVSPSCFIVFGLPCSLVHSRGVHTVILYPCTSKALMQISLALSHYHSLYPGALHVAFPFQILMPLPWSVSNSTFQRWV